MRLCPKHNAVSKTGVTGCAKENTSEQEGGYAARSAKIATKKQKEQVSNQGKRARKASE